MEIMRRAAVERSGTGRPPVRYVIVLTKVDKASKKELTATRRDVDRAVQELAKTFPQAETETENSGGAVGMDVAIVETSATARTGREQMWKLIMKLLAER